MGEEIHVELGFSTKDSRYLLELDNVSRLLARMRKVSKFGKILVPFYHLTYG
jgi:hypothetical protein